MKISILISGFGGQGSMSLGKFLARAALKEQKHTTWFPSYGAEMRGGTAHCFVKISDLPIASPFVDSPDLAIILNQPSLEKFKNKIKQKTLLIFNSNLIARDFIPKGVKNIGLPLNEIALDCGDIRVANAVILGILVFLMPDIFKKSTIISGLKEAFADKSILDKNLKAFAKGEVYVKS